MKRVKVLVLISAILLSTAYVEGFGIGFGPFDLEFGGGPRGAGDYYYSQGPSPAMLDDPICRAITQQKKLEFIVVAKEKGDSKEKKITTKRITVEPYAFGFTKKGNPILRGTVTEEKLVKEVSIKFGEDRDASQKAPAKDQSANKMDAKKDDKASAEAKGEKPNKEGIWGVFRSNKSKDNVESLNLAKVRHIRVLEDTHFDVPKNLDLQFKDGFARIVCQVPVQIEKNQPSTETTPTTPEPKK